MATKVLQLLKEASGLVIQANKKSTEIFADEAEKAKVIELTKTKNAKFIALFFIPLTGKDTTEERIAIAVTEKGIHFKKGRYVNSGYDHYVPTKTVDITHNELIEMAKENPSHFQKDHVKTVVTGLKRWVGLPPNSFMDEIALRGRYHN